jgi:hypothetical protein
MPNACFRDLPEIICRHLADARQQIRIAVCWFSHKDIFEVILSRLQASVQVELLLEYDSQNIRDEGLDFQQFIRCGGHLYAHCDTGLMHHKFALVDERLLLCGSFNWTYNSNAENLLVLDDTVLLRAFQEEFERQKATAKRIFTVRHTDVKVFSAFPIFGNTLSQLAGLRKKVSGGADVWVVRMNKNKAGNPMVFKENILPFDAAGLLLSYWSAFPMWDEKMFDEELKVLQNRHATSTLRNLRCWALRMKTGDLVLAVVRKNQLAGVGIIHSDPKPFAGAGFSSFREVQWVKVMENDPYLMPRPVSAQSVTQFRGSALRVLQEVFEKTQV